MWLISLELFKVAGNMGKPRSETSFSGEVRGFLKKGCEVKVLKALRRELCGWERITEERQRPSSGLCDPLRILPLPKHKASDPLLSCNTMELSALSISLNIVPLIYFCKRPSPFCK